MDEKDVQTARERYFPDMELIVSSRGHFGDYGHKLADIVLRQKELNDLEERAVFENDFSFVREVERLKINVSNHYSEREIKEKLIRRYTPYKRLNYSGQEKKKGQLGRLLEYCENNLIGGAFENIYVSSIKRLKAKNEK